MKIFLLFMLFSSPSLFASTLVVKKEKATIYSDTTKSSSLLEMKKGDKVESIKRVAMFWQVKTDKEEGFISILDVTRESEESSSLEQALFQSAKKHNLSEDNIRVRSAVMGVRGLNESDGLSEVGTLRPEMKSIYKMEERKVSNIRVENLETLINQEISNKINKRTVKK